MLHTLAGRRLRTVYYGWWIVGAWVLLNIYWAGTLNYGLTVFFVPVREAFGWDAALLALIFSLANILTGVLSPVMGLLFDRAGPRPLLLVGCTCGGAGLIALSRTTSLAEFVAAFGLVSIGYSMWAGGGIATAGLWFVRQRGLAMGIVVSGSAIGGLLVPVWQQTILATGWRTTFLIAGLGMLGLGTAASLVLRHRPADLGLLPDGDRPDADETAAGSPRSIRAAAIGPSDDDSPPPWVRSSLGFRATLVTWQFWLISAVTSIILAGSTAATVLLVPRLRESGVDLNVAVTAATLAILLGLVGRLGIGFLADRVSIAGLATFVFSVQALGLLALGTAPDRPLVLGVFVVAFGLSNDVARVLAALLLLRYYGEPAFGRILGVHQMVQVPGRVLGPVLAGASHDHGYGYGPALILLAVCSVAMAFPVWLLSPPRSGEDAG